MLNISIKKKSFSFIKKQKSQRTIFNFSESMLNGHFNKTKERIKVPEDTNERWNYKLETFNNVTFTDTIIHGQVYIQYIFFLLVLFMLSNEAKYLFYFVSISPVF